MTNFQDWRTEGVRIVRGAALASANSGPSGGRATVYDFTGSGGKSTWIGAVTLPPGLATGLHHHGRHEVALYVVKGRARIRWGERLEFAADLGPGDFAYFPPFVPHQEENLDLAATLDILAVRSDNERIAIKLDTPPVAEPEIVA